MSRAAPCSSEVKWSRPHAHWEGRVGLARGQGRRLMGSRKGTGSRKVKSPGRDFCPGREDVKKGLDVEVGEGPNVVYKSREIEWPWARSPGMSQGWNGNLSTLRKFRHMQSQTQEQIKKQPHSFSFLFFPLWQSLAGCWLVIFIFTKSQTTLAKAS